MSSKSRIQYACAVLLIVSSIALAFTQVYYAGDIAHGVLIYIAQAFLLAASIFGLEYELSKFYHYINGKKDNIKGNQK